MRLPLRRWIRLAALGTAVIGFMAGSVLSIRAIGEYHAYEERLHRAGSWLAVQAQVEYLSLLAAVERAVRSPGASEAVPLHFELLWSRLPLLLESEEAELLAQVPEAAATALDLMAALAEAEPAVQDFVRSPGPAAAEALVRTFEPFRPRLQRLVQAAALMSHDHGRAKTLLERRALVMLVFTFGTGALLVLMLVLEARAASIGQRDARLADMRLRSALEAASVGYVLFDAEERLAACNEHFRDMYGLSEDEVGARHSFGRMLRARMERGAFPEAEAGVEADPEAWMARRIARFRSAFSTDEQKLADGRWIEARERRLYDGSSVGVRIDITELKRREQALTEALARAESAVCALLRP